MALSGSDAATKTVFFISAYSFAIPLPQDEFLLTMQMLRVAEWLETR